MSKLETILKTQGWALADGATGTNLFLMGLQAGEAPELWNVEAPDRVKSLYSGAVDSGSDVFLTNSFGGNRSRLALHGQDKEVHSLNARAAELARDVADRADRPIVVAGSIGPTGELMGAVGTLSHETAVDMFSEQISGLIDGGVDVLWVETLSSEEEFRAAAEACGASGMPWCGTMSFDTAGRTMMGMTAPSFVALAEGVTPDPIAYGANCGVGASDLLRTVSGFVKAGATKPLIAKGNAGIPKYVDGHIHYDGTPELMADYAELAARAGASIIGGCCGTTPAHLKLMREALETRALSEPPTLDEIAERLGGFSSEGDGSVPGAQPEKRRSRRRR
ncbi:MAG: betaine--homocysteine S-methyltransferase [Pseudomonadota bacterium]